MTIDVKKLTDMLEKLNENTRGSCCESSAFIGEINGKPVRLTVMQIDEAVDEHYYEGTRAEHACVSL